MSIKTQFISILEKSAEKGNDARNKTMHICQNDGFSVEGKQSQIKKLQGELFDYLVRQIETVHNTVEAKIKSLEAYEEARQRERDSDPAYQNLLTATLSLLPAIADAPQEDLARRLQPFQDDRLAITAIEKVLKTASTEACRVYNSTVLPKYTLPGKIDRLKKLEKTMVNLLEDMELDVDKMAVLQNNVTAHSIRRLPVYTPTADYMNACNDDCTEYYPEKHVATAFVKQ